MPDFSASDINEAKRRVEEMRRRARNIVDESPPSNEQGSNAADYENQAPPTDKKADMHFSPINSLLSGLMGDDGDSSSALVLALILILSKEKADNMLILALLYILL